MSITHCHFLHLTTVAAVVASIPIFAIAQTYPTRPVHLIVGFPAGGGTDAIARLTAQSLWQRFGQQVVTDNRPGAGTNIATEAVVKASPDGHTLLLAGSPQAINATLYNKLAFNFVRDIAPVASIARGTYVVVVNPAFPARTVPELIAHAKANPGKISMASSGTGTPPHVAGELFKMMAGVDMLHVPYRGDAPALADLIGGHVQIYFSSLGGAIEHIKSGKLRAMAVTSESRSPALPDVPTIGEFIAGYEASGFWGIGAPKGTPVAIVERLNKDISASVGDPRLAAQFSSLGATPFALSVAAFRGFITSEVDKWAKVVKFAGIKTE